MEAILGVTMAVNGNLKDMALAELIQHTCQERKRARLDIIHADRTAQLFFDNGDVVHATLDDLVGEDVVYQVLGWEEGHFSLDAQGKPPARTIQRTWSGLLMEGARRLDEAGLSEEEKEPGTTTEGVTMASKLEDILKGLGDEINGLIAASVVGMDGLGIAEYSRSSKTNVEAINAQMALYVKLIDTTVQKLGVGAIEDDLLTTDNAFLLIRFLENKGYILGIAADRKVVSLGNLRLMSRLYAERLSKALPR